MNLPAYKDSSNLAKQGYESKKVTVDFLGLSYCKEPQDGELSDMKNLSSDNSPCLSLRKPRKIITKVNNNNVSLEKPTALATKDGKLAWVDGTNFYYNGVVKGTVTEGEKRIVTMINKIIIFPDKKYYDVQAGVLKNMEVKVSGSGMVFSTNSITYSSGGFSNFAAGDAVKISGCSNSKNNQNSSYIVIKSVTNTTITFTSDVFNACTENSTVTISKDVPNLDYICTSQNRLWGVHENTIYGSKLGDCTNFFCYQGRNDDSYTVQVETDGEFTGCANFSSHIAFFKEDCIHKLYGAKPSQYQVNTSYCRGLEKGSGKSLVAINDVLYYKSRSGIMAYLGSQPENISMNFGDDKFTNAIAGSDGDKYYISMYNKTKKRQEFLVYDITRQMWNKEDDTSVIDFCYCSGILYYIDTNNRLIAVNEENVSEKIEWMAELGNFSEYSENTKIYSKISARMELEIASEIYIDLKRDEGDWENIYANRAVEKGVVNLAFQPMKCNTFSIRLYGKGGVIIHSLVREYLIGSDE